MADGIICAIGLQEGDSDQPAQAGDQAPAEDAYRKDEANFRRAIDTAPALIHTGLSDGYLDFFNETWLKYAGVSMGELQGWAWTAVIHPHDLEGIVLKWRASLASGDPFLHEARVRRADGQYRWFSIRNVPLRDQTGGTEPVTISRFEENEKTASNCSSTRLRCTYKALALTVIWISSTNAGWNT